MSGGRAYRRVSSLPFQKLHEEALVVDTRTREVHLLNVTATRVWDLLERAHTTEQLLSALAEEFEAAPEVLRADVEALLGEMGQKGLVGPDVAGDAGPEGQAGAHRPGGLP